MYDVLVIGAGMSGLAAGIRLACFDRRVCILERHSTIGGLNSFYRLGGRNYDVGLHALTNFSPRGAKRGPLARVLRQLRFDWGDFELGEQAGSAIAFPDARLEFTNDPELLAAEVERRFPAERDGFRRLCRRVLDYDRLDDPLAAASARQTVAESISDPLLAEMLFCPLMFYGNVREHDMDFGQFSIMFRSIFLEGFSRPRGGVRLILKHLVRRFKSLGGELRLHAGVKRIAIEDGIARRVVLDDDSELEARWILSSAGWCETMRLCDSHGPAGTPAAGQLSFIESISTLSVPPAEIGCDRTIVFFNDSKRFRWKQPADLADVHSGVICCPNNFRYADGAGDPTLEGAVRITSLANFSRWQALDEGDYREEKRRWYEAMVASAVRFVPDFREFVVATDMFTPTTIRRFTGHDNGAVYGAPAKRLDGRTPWKNLFLCGTDQGFVGIVGSLVSGISMANQHCLREV